MPEKVNIPCVVFADRIYVNIKIKYVIAFVITIHKKRLTGKLLFRKCNHLTEVLRTNGQPIDPQPIIGYLL